MRIATISEMQNLDKQTIEELGIPSLVLMERAALGVNSVIETAYPGIFKTKKTILIAVGGGNNGGDGLALARMCHQKGKPVVVFTFADETKCSADNHHQLIICKSLGIPIKPYSAEEFKKYIVHSDIIIDSLFGVGLTRPITGIYQEAINEINLSGKPVIAVDIPSGIDGDNGQTLGIACNATHTVTFGLPKYGLLMDNAIDYIGKLWVIDIGIPYLYAKNLKGNLLNLDEIRKIIPSKRKLNTHKGTYGKVFIVAGSKMMSGAAVLCIKAALMSGVGLVYAGVPASIRETVANCVPGAIVIPLPEDQNGIISLDAYNEISRQLLTANAFAIGPGMGMNYQSGQLIKKIFDNFSNPAIIDADGINNLAELDKFKFKSPVILTPHAGELGKIINKNAAFVQQNRIFSAKESSEIFNCIMVLKGARTIVMDKNGTNWINTSGNPGMAKGGSGDILTGLMSGLLAQGLNPVDAAKLAVFWHGKAGDMAAQQKGQNCMTVEDILENIVKSYKDILG